MQGAPPLASPAFNRLRHLQTFSNMNPAEGLPGWSPANLAAVVPGGGLAFLSPAYPAFSLLPCPLSPNPFPNGEGEIYGYFMQGAPPLASPAFNRLRHLQTFSNMNPAEGLPGWSPADLAAVVPDGGLAFLSPAYPAFSLLPYPHPPAPFPDGEGGDQGYFMQGAPPLASPGLSPSGAGSRDEPLAQRGLARLVACQPYRCGARRGACFFCRPPTLPLACFPAPYPPIPLPRRGRG